MSAKGNALDGLKIQMSKVKSPNEKLLAGGGQFPDCDGFYPDCPDKPSLLDNKCRNCPKTDDLNKPRLDWVECEYCKEESVPVDTSSKLEEKVDSKCHSCNKINNKKHIINKIKNLI